MNFNPYLVFDVPMSADFDLLRATYRRLARENHPDVALDKSLATERMAQINRAWGILGDLEKRAAFDAQWQQTLAHQARREAAHRENARREAAHREMARSKARRDAGSRTTRPVVGSASRSKTAGPSRDAKRNAANHVRQKLADLDAPRRAAQPQSPLATGGQNQTASPRSLRAMRKVTLASRVWHRDGNACGAIEMCRAVLLSDSRNVPARELLSEIFAAQGRLEIAVMMLDQALQYAPDDQFLRRKRDQLERQRALGGALRAAKRPSLWQRLRARFSKKGK